MNPYIFFLSIYFLVTGALEFFIPERANTFYEKCVAVRNFRIFSLWAFAVGAVAYMGMPVIHLKWFILFIIWLYGVMGFWILFSPHSFLNICQKTYFGLSYEARIAMVRFDGLVRFIVAALLFFAARQ